MSIYLVLGLENACCDVLEPHKPTLSMEPMSIVSLMEPDMEPDWFNTLGHPHQHTSLNLILKDRKYAGVNEVYIFK